MKRVFINPEMCMGCLNCILACAVHQKKLKSVLELDITRQDIDFANQVVINHNRQIIPLSCRHCETPECVLSCMSGALTKDQKTGYVTVDKEKCAGCFMCVMSCPYGMIKPTKDKKKALKCDMCIDRETPACVESCPTKAIYLIEV